MKKRIGTKNGTVPTVLAISALSSCLMFGAVGIYRLSSDAAPNARGAEEADINSEEKQLRAPGAEPPSQAFFCSADMECLWGI